MAEAHRSVCSGCGYSIEAWSDGNPYVLDESDRKRHVYHPNHPEAPIVGNDVPHLCLSCGRKFKVDTRRPVRNCPKCGSDDLCDTFELTGKPCPKCKKGSFTRDPDYIAIS